eukprot:807020-Alexandrium_andersonii.AAC.1
MASPGFELASRRHRLRRLFFAAAAGLRMKVAMHCVVVAFTSGGEQAWLEVGSGVHAQWLLEA